MGLGFLTWIKSIAMPHPNPVCRTQRHGGWLGRLGRSPPRSNVSQHWLRCPERLHFHDHRALFAAAYSVLADKYTSRMVILKPECPRICWLPRKLSPHETSMDANPCIDGAQPYIGDAAARPVDNGHRRQWVYVSTPCHASASRSPKHRQDKRVGPIHPEPSPTRGGAARPLFRHPRNTKAHRNGWASEEGRWSGTELNRQQKPV